MIRVVEAAAERFDWKKQKAQSGYGCGMVCLDYLDTYVVAMAKIHVDRNTGRVHVDRVVHAQDMGPVINPEGARLQIEGAITMGLGYCLGEEVHFNGGVIKDLNFDTYDIARMSWAPDSIEAILVENHDVAPSGCGEPPIVGMGALIANAVFDATGIRMHRLPITPDKIKAGLKENAV
jgi:nicotinate dehydrogenase subunit B